MNVSLTPQLEKFVNTKVKSGRYNSASEVVREALRLLEEHDRFRVQRLAEFRIAMDGRLASLDRGEGVDGAEFFETLERDRNLRPHPGESVHEAISSRAGSGSGYSGDLGIRCQGQYSGRAKGSLAD